VAACLFYFFAQPKLVKKSPGTAENSGRVAVSNVRLRPAVFCSAYQGAVRRRYILDGTSCVIQRTTHAPGGRLPSLSSSTSWPSSTSCEEGIGFGSLSLRISPRSPFHFSFSPVRLCSLFASKSVEGSLTTNPRRLPTIKPLENGAEEADSAPPEKHPLYQLCAN
jgi:hypothetical protein